MNTYEHVRMNNVRMSPHMCSLGDCKKNHGECEGRLTIIIQETEKMIQFNYIEFSYARVLFYFVKCGYIENGFYRFSGVTEGYGR